MEKRRKRQGEIPFAVNLKRIMKERGISQRELSKLTGVKLATLNDWLNNAAPQDLQAVASMAQFLKVDFQFLLLGTYAEKRSPSELNLEEIFEIEHDPDFSGLFLLEAKRLKRRK